MIRNIVFVTALSFAAMAAPVLAQTPAAAPAAAPAATAALSTASATLGQLLDNPAARAVLQRHIPDLVNNPQIEQGRDFTLRDIQQYVPDQLTNEKLAAIDADLAMLAH